MFEQFTRDVISNSIIHTYSWSSVPQVRMKPSAIPRLQYSPPWCHASLVDGNDPASFRLSFLDGPALDGQHLWVVPLICPIGLLYVVQKSQLLATLLINLGSFKWNPGLNDRGKDLIDTWSWHDAYMGTSKP